MDPSVLLGIITVTILIVAMVASLIPACPCCPQRRSEPDSIADLELNRFPSFVNPERVLSRLTDPREPPVYQRDF